MLDDVTGERFESEVPPPPWLRRISPDFVVSAVRKFRGFQGTGTPARTVCARLPTLEVPDHAVTEACVPAIDFHTHLGRWLRSDGRWMEPDVPRVVDIMERCNIKTAVNLDGRSGARARGEPGPI